MWVFLSLPWNGPVISRGDGKEYSFFCANSFIRLKCKNLSTHISLGSRSLARIDVGLTY